MPRRRCQSAPARLLSRQLGRVTEALHCVISWLEMNIKKWMISDIQIHEISWNDECHDALGSSFPILSLVHGFFSVESRLWFQTINHTVYFSKIRCCSDVQAHKAGTCKPCAYFFAKADGCRWHNSCEFCCCLSVCERPRWSRRQRPSETIRDHPTPSLGSGYCVLHQGHLCPPGEIKKRKKQKILRPQICHATRF